MSFFSGFCAMAGLAAHSNYPSLGWNAKPKHTGVLFLCVSCHSGFKSLSNSSQKIGCFLVVLHCSY